MFDREMRYVAASTKWLKVYGRTETPVGRCFYEDVPDIDDAWKALHRRCLDGATEESAEGQQLQLKRPDGGVMWVTWLVSPWTDRAGAIGGIVIYGEDITARIEAEKKAEDLARRLAASAAQSEDTARRAQAAERRLNDAVEAIPEGFLVFDADDRLVVCNKAARDMYPRIADQLRPGVTFEHLLCAVCDLGSYDGVIADKESFVREGMERRRDLGRAVERLTSDGRWLRLEERPMPEGGVVALWTDITDFKTRERELALKNALLEATLANIGEGIIVLDADRKLLIDNAGAKLLDMPARLSQPGVSFEELVRFRIERGDFGAVDVEAELRERIALFEARHPWRQEWRLRDGRVIETRYNPIPDGRGIYVHRDVTERADYEAKLAQKTALLEATFQNIGEGVLVYDTDGKLLAGNNLAGRLLDAPDALFEPGAALDDLVRFRVERGDHRDDDIDESFRAKMAHFRAGTPWRAARRLPDGRVIESRLNPRPGGGAVFVFLDVTEATDREAKLAEKTALLEATLENIGEGIIVHDANRKVLIDSAGSKLLDLPARLSQPGVAIDELIRFRIERGDLGPVADVEASVRERIAAIEARRPWSLDMRLPDGRIVETRFNPMPDGRGIFVNRDVTERVDREAKLAEKTALLEATLHNMGEGVVVFDADRKLRIANDNALRLVDLPQELVQPGASFDDGASFRAEPGDFGGVAGDYFVNDRVAAFGAQERWSRTRRLPDGRMIDTRFNPMPDGGGILVFRDVTELAAKTTLLEATLENMGEGIFAFDPNRKLLIANENALRLVDLPPEFRQPGASFDEGARFRAERGDFGDGDVDSLLAERVAMFDAGKPVSQTRRFANGRTIDTRFNPMPGGGGVFVFRDVTELVDKQADLTAALARAEKASRAKSEFLAMASHELRTPMNAIIGMAAMLRESDLKPAERRWASMIEAAGESLLMIINDLLEFSSLDSGNVTFETAPFDAGDVAASMIAMARVFPQAAGLSIVADVDPAVPAALLGDRGRIRRILVNMLDNAVKHTAKGSVTLRVRAAPAGGAESVTLRMEVEDTGTGFPPSEASRLFEPFERGASADRTRDPGLGLGLASSKRLVDLMGGTIGAESKPGFGSRFWFEIPVRVATPPSEAAATPPKACERRPLKILAAEDIEANREVMGAMLQKLGHEAHFAEDGVQAVEAAEKDHYDVILMDIQMPNMDGLEATRAIRGLGGRFESLPIIAVSAYSLASDKDAAFAAGMSDFLTKPVRRSALDATLRAFTEKPGNPQLAR